MNVERAGPLRRKRAALVAGAILVLVVTVGAVATSHLRKASPGRIVSNEPDAIPASFPRRSYAPGDRAMLHVEGKGGAFILQVFRVGAERLRPPRDNVLMGVPVSGPRRVLQRGETTVVQLDIGPRWPSGFYFARLSRPGSVGFAPFVLRPRTLGENRVLVVMPTHTWQAYNFRDVDDDGTGDTWYADPKVKTVVLTRPYLNRGVPPHFRGYDRAFLRWLQRTGKKADFVADDDLEAIASGDELARRYDLVVFPGHEEYIAGHVLDVAQRYRDLGGNLAFLSANTFFYAVERRGDRLLGRELWSKRGRPSAPLTGSTYVGWFEDRYPNRPYIVTGARIASWLFRGTGLRNGDSFGSYGIEVDARDERSPAGTRVLARINDIFGKGHTAEMTYYETKAGAKVFSAGVMNFGGSLEYEPQSTMMENLWRRLAKP